MKQDMLKYRDTRRYNKGKSLRLSNYIIDEHRDAPFVTSLARRARSTASPPTSSSTFHLDNVTCHDVLDTHFRSAYDSGSPTSLGDSLRMAISLVPDAGFCGTARGQGLHSLLATNRTRASLRIANLLRTPEGDPIRERKSHPFTESSAARVHQTGDTIPSSGGHLSTNRDPYLRCWATTVRGGPHPRASPSSRKSRRDSRPFGTTRTDDPLPPPASSPHGRHQLDGIILVIISSIGHARDAPLGVSSGGRSPPIQPCCLTLESR